MARKSRKQSKTALETVVTGMKIWRAALYIRLSVEDKGDHGDSLETQRKIMEAFLALCPDIRQTGIYTDNGTTGRTFERPAFQQMIADVESGKIDCILVKDLSRLGRNTIDTGYYIEKYFPVKGVRFIAVNDQYDSEHNNISGSQLTLPLKNMVNEAYAFDISRKVRLQARESMKAGDFIGARPPYGFLKAPDNCHKLVVNVETAPVVRDIFQWAAEGVPLNVMVKRLNESGAVTPGQYAASRGLFSYENKLAGSGKWQTWTVSKILEDEVYVGDMVQGKTKTVGHKQIPTERTDWIVVPNTHEPLVSRELFGQARVMRQLAAEKCSKSKKNPYSENVLRGRIFCAHCGKNLHRQRKDDRYFFHCISNDRIAKGACDSRIYLIESDLFQTILTIVKEDAKAILGKRMEVKQADAKLDARRKTAISQLMELRKTTTEKQRLLKGLYEHFVIGILTSEEYRDMKAVYEQEIKALVQQTQAIEEHCKSLDNEVERLFSLADKLEQIAKKPRLTASLVEQLVERITVFDNENITVDFRFKNDFAQITEVLDGE